MILREAIRETAEGEGKWVEQAFKACGKADEKIGFSRCGNTFVGYIN